MRVLALIDHLALGGAQMLLSQFAAAAPAAGIGFGVTCIASLEGDLAAAPLRAADVEPIDLGLAGRPGLHTFRSLRAHLAAQRPDLVHTHLDTAMWLGGLSARSLGIPVVGTIHGVASRSPGLEEHAKRRLVRACSDRLITVSMEARRAYAARHWASDSQLVMIHNGIDVTAVPGAGRAVRRELGLHADDIVAGMVSSLRPEKAHDLAIAAVGRLRTDFPRLRLLIVGDGALRTEIERRAAPLGDAVVLAGARDDIMSCLDACDVCVHPSRTDAFPTALIEAMAASVPIVASAVGGIPEITSDGETGTLVAPELDSFCAGLAALLADATVRGRHAAAGRARYEREFTAGPWVAQTRAVYEAVLRERGRSPAGAPVAPGREVGGAVS
jgi:glycosyltransferase involved in cell wall biosynthesis